jgi:hypothetical protein
LRPDTRTHSNRGILGAMIEMLRLSEVQRLIAIFLALVSFCITYKWAGQRTLERAMRLAPHDGQIGLGMIVMGLMVGVPMAILMYLLSFNILRTWERGYTQKLDEMERISDQTDSKS